MNKDHSLAKALLEKHAAAQPYWEAPGVVMGSSVLGGLATPTYGASTQPLPTDPTMFQGAMNYVTGVGQNIANAAGNFGNAVANYTPDFMGGAGQAAGQFASDAMTTVGNAVAENPEMAAGVAGAGALGTLGLFGRSVAKRRARNRAMRDAQLMAAAQARKPMSLGRKAMIGGGILGAGLVAKGLYDRFNSK